MVLREGEVMALMPWGTVEPKKVMPWGKHKGKPMSAVPVGYLRWLMTTDDLEPRLMWAIKAELKRRRVEIMEKSEVVLLLNDLEDRINQAIGDDPSIGHEIAGVLADHVLEAFGETHRRLDGEDK